MIPVRITVHATMPLPSDSNLAPAMALLDERIDELPGVFTQWGLSRGDGGVVHLIVQACAGIPNADAVGALCDRVMRAASTAGLPDATVAAEAMTEADVVIGSPLALYLAVSRVRSPLTTPTA